MNPNPLQNSPIVFTDSQGRDIPEVQVNSGTVNSRFDYDYDLLGRRIEVATLDRTWG